MSKLIIDIGSNSIKTITTKDREIINKNKTDIALYNMINGYSTNNHIIGHLMIIIEDIIKANQKFGIKETVIYATEAMRGFEGKDELSDKIRKKFGVNLKLLTPSQEANFGFQVVSKNYSSFDNLLSIDIGGASTEVSLGLNKKFSEGVSLQVGTSNTGTIGLARVEAEASLGRIKGIIRGLPEKPLPVLTGGTVECIDRLGMLKKCNKCDYFNLSNFNNSFNQNKNNLSEYRRITTPNAITILEYVLGDLLDAAEYNDKINICREDLRFYFI